MADTMMQLGAFQFSLPTAAYEKLTRHTEWRWVAQDRLGRKPARQYLGPGDETITLEGTVFPGFRGGLNQVRDMRREADKGTPLLLVDSLGYIHGYHCIQSLEESRSGLHTNGAPRKITFTMTLSAYGEDTRTQ